MSAFSETVMEPCDLLLPDVEFSGIGWRYHPEDGRRR